MAKNNLKSMFQKNKITFIISAVVILAIIISLIIYFSRGNINNPTAIPPTQITTPSGSQGEIVQKDTSGGICILNSDCKGYANLHCQGGSNVRCAGDNLCHCCVVSTVTGACEGCDSTCTGDKYCQSGVCVSKTGGKTTI